MATDRARVCVAFPAAPRCDHVDTAANLAVVLALAGRRVLVVDWSGAERPVREYLEPFADGREPCPDELWAGVREVATAGVAGALSFGVLRHFTVHGAESGTIALVAAESDLPLGLDLSRAAPTALSVLRRELGAAGYDDVLLVMPTVGPDDVAEAAAVASAVGDTVLVAIAPNPRSVADAAAVTEVIRGSAPIAVTVLPVLTRVHDEKGPRLFREVRATAARTFVVLFAEQADRVPLRRCVELPLLPYQEILPILSTVAEPADSPLWGEYRELATAVTGEPAQPWRTVPVRVREGYRTSARLAPAGSPRQVVVVAPPELRAWVAWARTHLTRVGAEVIEAAEPPAPTTDPATTDSATTDPATTDPATTDPAPTVLRLHAGDCPPGGGADVVDLRVPEQPYDPAEPGAPDTPADTFRRTMLTKLGFLGLRGPQAGRSTRFPWSAPRVQRLPAASRTVDIDDPDVRALREALVDRSAQRAVVVIDGPPGTCKTALARAYAAHYAWDYQGVWWISAHDRRSLLRSLAGLARALEPEREAASLYGSTAALSWVVEPARGRFLLVYDGDSDLGKLAADGLLPDELGDVHVLVTASEEPTGVPVVARLGLGPLRPGQAAARLIATTPELAPDAAAEVAAALGHWPLAISLAGAWLAETAEHYRGQGHDDVSAAADAHTALVAAIGRHPGLAPTAVMVSVVRDTLHSLELDELTGGGGLGAVAVLLAECFHTLSPLGARLELVQSRELLSALARHLDPQGQGLLFDSAQIDRALRLGERYELIQVDWGLRGTVQVDPAIRAVLAELADPEHVARVAELVLDTLAEFAPVESAPAAARTRFRALFDHVECSGALASGRPQVRRWLVNQAHYHYDTGNAATWAETLAHGDDLLARWDAWYPAEDPLRLRLMGQLANLERALGDAERAWKLDAEALGAYQRGFGAETPAALTAARGVGGDVRGLGGYLDALAEDERSFPGFVREFGEDHPQTRRAANNLAASLYLSGATARALVLERDNHRRLVRLFGAAHELAEWSAVRVAIYERDLDLGRPAARLSAIENRLRGRGGALRRLRWVVEWQWSMALRDQGSLTRARDRFTSAHKGLRALLPEDHPDITAVMLTGASIRRRSGIDLVEAREQAATALARLDERRFPAAHPIRALAELGVGLATAAAGDRAAGRDLVRRAHDALHDRLDRMHPWTLAAALDLAVLTAAGGELETARGLTEEALEDLLDAFGADHPHAAVARDNLELAELGEHAHWREIDVDIPHT
ncbi:FxSxx-COOH system tetratricopeptide repeat protein [Actinokineospora sp. NBRC 105648]|uniref:FxSxx-COOH system tetratricopeptide repeat protein n=1 Tax=Actinokineospora sp. NBRC 105648 TaxID=3032206 RepID=UPI0024A500A3|nr:FxSxx-COOH system tetratricopeptide repeat protein [Actinokineospora sp. NBRC 105648]GLZ41968.1 NTPase [Actinokineospora sp. NBRC 105648]